MDSQTPIDFLIAQSRYRDFRYQGAAVFATITEHDGDALMDRPSALTM